MEENGSAMKERLMQFLHSQKITQAEFTKALGVAPAYVGTIRKGIPAAKVKRIGELYPQLNRDWLLYGEGEMLLDEGAKRQQLLSREYTIPLLPVEASAGTLQMWSEGVRPDDCRMIVSPVKSAEMAIPIKGDSMEPRFHDGSTLLVKKINDSSFIPWGHTMVIDTENGVLVKNVFPAEDQEEGEDSIVVKSLNPKYPPFKIPKSSIYGLYRVVGMVEFFPTL